VRNRDGQVIIKCIVEAPGEYMLSTLSMMHLTNDNTASQRKNTPKNKAYE